ncbi:MAG: hypothetical protein JRI35_04040 [Deltaproteobacteria bacterium]|nr:hypothetical protein [Deltaproteobacteria bacterium]
MKRLPFSGFQSSLIADRRGSAIWPDGNRSLEGDISLNSLTEAPIVFSAFAVGETASPLSAA